MSTGIRQKLAIAICLCSGAPILILDEPTANLDPTVRGRVMNMVADAYKLYKRAQGLDGLRLIDKLRGQRTIGLYGLLYAWRSLRAGKVLRAVGLTITNFWAIPIALFELLRKGLKFFKPIK